MTKSTFNEGVNAIFSDDKVLKEGLSYICLANLFTNMYLFCRENR